MVERVSGLDGHTAAVAGMEPGVVAVLSFEIGDEVRDALDYDGAVGTAGVGMALHIREARPASTSVELGPAQAALRVSG
jgi:hypothetical protein